MPAIVAQHRVVPLAKENRTSARVIAIAQHALHFHAFALAICYKCNGVDVVSKDELPFGYVFADYFVRLPTEETFGGSRPARDAEVAVPFDDRQRRALDVKRELPVSALHRFLGLLSRSYVCDDCDAAGDVVVFVDQRSVTTLEGAGFGRSVWVVLTD